MGKINFVIDDELDEKFRKVIFKRMGMKKGNISLAIEQAIKEWINN